MSFTITFVSLFVFTAFSAPPAKKGFPQQVLTKADCPEIDFSALMGPVRYQGGGYLGTNMCHAFAAADLITVNQNFKAENRISALDVANTATAYRPSEVLKELPSTFSVIEAKQRVEDLRILEELHILAFDYPPYMWGGYPNIDIEAYNLREFACTEKKLPSEAGRKMPDRSTFAQDTINNATTIKKNEIIEWNRWNPGLTKSKFQTELELKLEAALQLRRESADLLRKKCDKNLRLKPMISHHIPMEVGEASRKTIELFKKGIPVAIGYDDSVLHGQSFSRDASHASTIAGSRWNARTSSCEFKLRNSKGPDCVQNGTWDCQEGNYWIPEWQYSQMVTSLFYIDKQK